MKRRINITLSPRFEGLRKDLERLPELFVAADTSLREGRNSVRRMQLGGEELVVKRYRRIHCLNRLLYATLRRSKAERAYEHGLELLTRGIPTPEPVARVDVLCGCRLCDSYSITRYSSAVSLTEAVKNFPHAEAQRILSSFARFMLQVHDRGVLHEDLNAANVLYRKTEEGYAFELIDINRLKFRSRLSLSERLRNLRRLTDQTLPYLHVVERYAEAMGREPNGVLLRGSIFRFACQWFYDLKARLK